MRELSSPQQDPRTAYIVSSYVTYCASLHYLYFLTSPNGCYLKRQMVESVGAGKFKNE